VEVRSGEQLRGGPQVHRRLGATFLWSEDRRRMEHGVFGEQTVQFVDCAFG
jgi:hypothetical protein